MEKLKTYSTSLKSFNHRDRVKYLRVSLKKKHKPEILQIFGDIRKSFFSLETLLLDSIPPDDILPKSLTRLKIHHFAGCFSQLPESLCILAIKDFGTLNPDFSHLPSNITTLKISNVHIRDATISQLPKNLERLKFQGNISISSSSLPQNLITLSLLGDVSLIDLNHLQFPQGLIQLKLAKDFIRESHLNRLPNKLTKLSLPESTFLTNTSIALLPSQLTTLCLGKSTQVTGECFPFLPPTLTKIRLQPRKIVERYFCNVRDFHLKDLPKSITSFKAGLDVSSDQDIQDFPREIKEIEIIPLSDITDISMKKFPPHLIFLSIKSPKLTNACIRDLPSTLVTFILRGNENLTDEAIMHLPCSLQVLVIEKDKKLTNQAIKFLPPFLRIFRLINNINLTKECLKLLPRTLTQLAVGEKSKITLENLRVYFNAFQIQIKPALYRLCQKF